MLSLLKFYIFINVCLVFVKCFIPNLSVQKLDRHVIQKKREDTLEMCRIFNAENKKLQQELYNSHSEEPHRRRRFKRDAGQMRLGNPVLDDESAKRIENIVDKLYEDLEETVTYRKRKLETSPAPTETLNNTMRRFNFAPAELIRLTTMKPKSINDSISPGVPWHKKWTHGIVPYFIDPKTYDAQLADTIIKAFDYFERATCIRLQKLKEKPTDKESMQNVEWLYITNPSGIRQCVHSNEKKANKGVQKIVFGYDCLSLGQIVHEVMHILGFSHEHTRPDRDHFISILWNNIKPGYKKYFEKRTKDQLLNIPYDYSSVLHYPHRAFSKNGQITIMGQAKNDLRLGQREGLSERDVEKVTYIFGHECIARNKQYLLKTCPRVVRSNLPWKNISRDEITNYFNDRLWPYGIVNYKIKDKMEFTTEERENIKAVINHIEKETCIRFKDLSEDNNKSEDDGDDNSDKNQNTLEPGDEEVKSNNDESNGGTGGDFEGDGSGGGTGKELNGSDGGISGIGAGNNDNKGKGDDNSPLKGNDLDNEDSIKLHSEANNEITKTDDDQGNRTPTGEKRDISTLRKGVEKKKSRIKASKIIKPGQVIPQSISRTARRHAADIFVFVRSTEPGCICPPPGKPSGNANLKINADCFNSVNDLLHLFVHLLGLDHQHNMHDRDQYLHILWENLTPEIKNEMREKLPPAASVGFGYDYQSVMHYPWLQIKNGVTNMMYPIWNDGWAMGHWQGLSSIDVQKLNNLYFEQCVERKKQEQQE